jgi:hypothetical protein
VTEDELEEVAAAIERARTEATRAYGFCPGSYTYHAYISCLAASRIVTAALERMKKA